MVSMSCSIISMPTSNCLCSSCSIFMKRRLPLVSSPASTSSSKSSFGLVHKALAISRAFNSVRASSVAALRSALSPSLVKSSTCSMRPSSTRPVAKRWATTRFSRTVSSCSGCGIWKVRPMPMRARRCKGMDARSAESKAMRPADGLTRPDTALNRVVLPAPLGPTRPRTSSRPALSVTASTAVSPPKRTVSASSCSMLTPGRLAQQGQQAARTEDDHGDQQAAEYQLMAGWDQVLEHQLVDQVDRQCSGNRPPQCAVAAEDGRNDGQRHPYAIEGIIRFKKADVMHIERPHDARHEGGNKQHHGFQQGAVDADDACRIFAVVHGAQCQAVMAGTYGAIAQHENHQDRQNDQIAAHLSRQVYAEKLREARKV